MLRLALVALIVAAPALAQQGNVPQRIRSVEIRKGETCPKAQSAGEVVVCRTVEEPYRIPSELRDDGPIPVANQAWAARAAADEQTSRVAGGLPDSCSPVGLGGQSGCALQANRAYAAERRAGNVQGR